jgi:hypothetical protein
MTARTAKFVFLARRPVRRPLNGAPVPRLCALYVIPTSRTSCMEFRLFRLVLWYYNGCFFFP